MEALETYIHTYIHTHTRTFFLYIEILSDLITLSTTTHHHLFAIHLTFPLQLTELQTEFDSLEGVGRARAERYLRSQGPPKEKAPKEDAEDGEEDEEEEDSQDSALDPYELLDPVDILAKLPKNFYEQVG